MLRNKTKKVKCIYINQLNQINLFLIGDLIKCALIIKTMIHDK